MIGDWEIPADEWGSATAAYTDEAFARRIKWCRDVEKLKAAARHEANRHGEPRTERIARINQRIAEVRERE